MGQRRNLKRMYKKAFKENNIDATKEQLDFLLTHYLDEDYILGIHNSSRDHEYFFENGLYNQDSRGKDSDDLTNTVMCSDNLDGLVKYPNGDGKNRGKTAIILKIPKKVFRREQGIFEILEDGKFGIPPEFMLAAFHDGVVEHNPKYDKDYVSESAVNCSKNNEIRFNNKKMFAGIFKKIYRQEIFKNKAMDFIRRITGRKQKQLSLPEGEKSREDVTTFKEQLANEYGAPNLQEQKAFSEKIQRGNSGQQTYLSESEEEIE